MEKGLKKDYYIAIGLTFKGKYEFPIKEYFWSMDNFNFDVLPSINPMYAEQVSKFN